MCGGVGESEALDLGLGEAGADRKRQHLAVLHEGGDARRVLVAFDAAEEALAQTARIGDLSERESLRQAGAPQFRADRGAGGIRRGMDGTHGGHSLDGRGRAGIQWLQVVSMVLKVL